MPLKVVCPFHDDHEPSMAIYPDGHVYCYGCGFRGHVLDAAIGLLGMRAGILTDHRELVHVPPPGYVDPGEEIPYDPSHPALKGVRCSWRFLASYGAILRRRALEIPFMWMNGEVSREKQYRIRPGKYMFPAGFRVSQGIGILGEGTPRVAVEGLLDALRLIELGFRGTCLVTFGTGLSVRKIEILKEFAPIYLMMDNDDAGRRASDELCKNISPVAVVPYHTEDPQELDEIPEVLR